MDDLISEARRRDRRNPGRGNSYREGRSGPLPHRSLRGRKPPVRREQGPSDFALVIAGYDVGSGSPVIVNPHDPTPCSTTSPCRQELKFDIPDATNGTATFTDATFDAQGNFVVAGYYETFEPDVCRPECYDDLYAYLPVVVKVDRDNQLLFEAIEPSDSPVRFVHSDNSSTAVRASVTGGEGASVFMLVSGGKPTGRLVRLDSSGARMSHRLLPAYLLETFSGRGCRQWSPLWYPAAMTAASAGRLVVTASSRPNVRLSPPVAQCRNPPHWERGGS